jgi:cyclic pyranopterin phosphate synthase
MVMTDGYGRKIDYLRISVTDKCNLRCKYCMPLEGVEHLHHGELLSLEEIARLVGIMAKMGLKKVRLTGGEPLVRKNIEKLIADIHGIPQIEDIAVTTNGTLLKGRVANLKENGVGTINISLDTLDRETFKNITGFDQLENVTEVIGEVLSQDIKCKINCVPCREFNYKSLVDLAGLAKDKPIDVRFIELMPIGCGKNYTGISSREILDMLEAAYGVSHVSKEACDTSGPAKYFEFDAFKGRIGFISPISHRFCSNCNRIRLTAQGSLKLCLHYNYGVDLKSLLRNGASDDRIGQAILEALKSKPQRHDFENSGSIGDDKRYEDKKMVQIGG